MSFLICGNIIAQRLTDGTLQKVPMNLYNSHSYVDLFKTAQELNQPHLERLQQVFQWLEDPTTQCELGIELSSMLKKKAQPQDRSFLDHQKYLYLAAYNDYYDVNYFPSEVPGLSS